MITSSKPKKQRHFRYNAPMHIKQHFMHAHVDKSLKTKLSIKKRSIQISKGDTVKVMSGGNKGKSGKVTLVNMRKGLVYIDSLKKKTTKGKEYSVGINSSNVYITDLNLTDKVRAAKLNLQAQQKEKAIVQEKIENKSESVVDGK